MLLEGELIIQKPMQSLIVRFSLLFLAIYPCGDKIRESDEEWDDGNFATLDGWDQYCKFESNISWENHPLLCNQWGNSQKESSEEWDDGNTTDGDGWSSVWTIESGWIWTQVSGYSKDTWSELWGDGNYKINTSDYLSWFTIW